MSEPFLSTTSMTCMHLKKFKVFSSLCRSETHFRHAQVHQRASALTGSINFFQSTIITVYEVQNQKTVNLSCRNTSILFVQSFSGKQDFRKFKEIFPYKKQRVLRFTYNSMFFFRKISSVYRKCTVFQVLFRTNSYFCWLCFLHSVWVRKPKKWQQPVPDHFDGSEDFFSELFFWITVWRASKEQFNFSETKSNFKGAPLTSKATSGYFGQSVWNWIKGKVFSPFPFEKSRPDRNKKGFT